MMGIQAGDSVRRVGLIWVDTVSYEEMLILLRERPTTVQIALTVTPEEIERVNPEPSSALTSREFVGRAAVVQQQVGAFRKGEFNPIFVRGGQQASPHTGGGSKYGFPMTELHEDSGGFIKLKYVVRIMIFIVTELVVLGRFCSVKAGSPPPVSYCLRFLWWSSRLSGLRRPEDSVSDYVSVISDGDEW